MHTLHWIAVEAENAEEAFGLVESALDQEEGFGPASWSDWHIVGGGRYNVQEGEDWKTAYVDGRTNMVVSYKDNQEQFFQIMRDIRKYRVEEMRRLVNDIDLDFFGKTMNAYIENRGEAPDEYRRGLNHWYVTKAAEMIVGSLYTPESYFYDLESYTTSLSALTDRLEANPNQQFLVPVDFHF